MTNNRPTIIEQLVSLVDQSDYKGVNAYDVVTALLFTAPWRAVNPNQPEGWLKLEADAIALITRETDIEPDSDAWATTLAEIRSIMLDDDDYND